MSKFAKTLVLISLLLSACNMPLATAATATEAIVPTVELATPDPEATPIVVVPTEADAGVPFEAILITQPGNQSVVTSPVLVEGQSRPAFEQNLVVAIYDVDGNQLALQPTTIQADAGLPGPFSIEIPFSVGSEGPGRIAVYETSALDGGIVHLSSVEITLTNSGTATLQEAQIALENIVISSPLALAEVSGGFIAVSGFSEYYFESQIGLVLCGGGGSGAPHELCGTEDNVLASSVAMIDSPDMGMPGPFSGELTYSISAQTPARIVLYASSMRDGGLTHVSSIPILLNP
jgi:hypothetical protein